MKQKDLVMNAIFVFDPEIFRGFQSGDDIEITYSMLYTGYAISSTEPSISWNYVWIEYSNNPYDDSKTAPSSGYTVAVVNMAFEIYKYTGILGDENSETPLSSAHFELRTDPDDQNTATKFVLMNDGVYRYASEEEIADEAVDVTTTLVSDTDGMIYVTGLAGNKENKDFVPKGIQSKMYNRAVSNAAYLFESTYYLVETKAPDGYNLMDGYITVKVIYCPTIAGSVITQMLYLPGEVADINTPMFSIKGSPIPVQNLTGTLFPETGGIGTTIFTITGIVLMIGAAVVLIAKKRVSVKN